MRAKIIAVPVAAGLALGGASLATGAEERPQVAPAERPAFAVPPIAMHHSFGPFLPEPYPFGLHRDLAEDMAAELDLPADRVAEAMRKAIAAQFDHRRDEALKCFDDRNACEVAEPGPALILPPRRPMPARPGKTVRP